MGLSFSLVLVVDIAFINKNLPLPQSLDLDADLLQFLILQVMRIG